MKKVELKNTKTRTKVAAEKEPKKDNFYTIPNEACCSAEFPDGCIFSDEM